MENRERTNVVVGSIWMLVITVALFFLPLVNGLVGGLVGGYKVGGWKRALAAAVLPAVVASVVLWVLVAAMGAPVWGFVAGTALAVIILLADVGIFLGAIIGGKAAESRGRRMTASPI